MVKKFPVFDFKFQNIVLAICIVFNTVLSILISLLMGDILDAIAVGELTGDIWIFIAMIMILTVLSSVISIGLAQYLPMKILLEKSIDASRTIIDLLLKTSYKNYTKHDKGYYINLITSSAFTYGDIYSQMNITLIGNILCVILLFCVSAFINPYLGIVFAIFILLYYVVMNKPSKATAKYQEKGLPTQDEFLSETKRIVEEKRAINIAQANKFYTNRFFEKSKHYLSFIQRFRFYEIITENLPQKLSNIFQIAVLAISIYLYSLNKISLGTIIVSYQLSGLLHTPLDYCIGILMNYRINRVHLDRLNQFATMALLSPGFENLYRDSKKLFEIKNGKFYTTANQEQLLFEVDYLSIEKGSLTVVKGANGSGKSMLTNFLTGYSDIDSFSGEIILDSSLKNAAYLSYPILIVNGKFRENLFDRKPPQDLCEALNITISDKVIDDNVINLSYGEQQKLNLLRVFSLNSEVVILDEPLTNLDKNSIEQLINYIASKKGKISIIAIMHSDELDIYADYILEIRHQQLIDINDI